MSVSGVDGVTCIGGTDKLQQEQARDVYTSQIIEALKGGESTNKKRRCRYSLEKGVLCHYSIKGSHHPQVIVPATLRPLVIEQLHDKSGHLDICIVIKGPT